jgi:hypothetical protein
MLYEESVWFKNMIQQYVEPNSLVLNIGSSTKQFIEVDQPYIKQNLFDELAKKNCAVKNIDIKQAEGVDLVGDVTDPAFIQTLKQLNPSFIICSNLLEHLTDRKTFCDALVKIMNTKTMLIVSVPYSFPYHEDPIDTLYRPDINELQKAFPLLKLEEGKIVDCGFYFALISKGIRRSNQFLFFMKTILRMGIAILTFNEKKVKNLSWNFKRVSATCAVFKLKD